jgi:hypothetical protein
MLATREPDGDENASTGAHMIAGLRSGHLAVTGTKLFRGPVLPS